MPYSQCRRQPGGAWQECGIFFALDIDQDLGLIWALFAVGRRTMHCSKVCKEKRMFLNYHPVLWVLLPCCVLLLVGFSYRDRRWGPWTMLVAVVALLVLMSGTIISLLD